MAKQNFYYYDHRSRSYTLQDVVLDYINSGNTITQIIPDVLFPGNYYILLN
jgi:hypothetical protein